MKTDTASRQQVGRIATLPRVNLLPPELEERKKLRQIQFGLGIIVIAAVGGVVYFYQHAAGATTDAQQKIDAATAQHSSLQHKLNGLSDVSQTAATVQAREAMLSQATATDVHWSGVMNDLSVNIPNNVWLTKMDIRESVAPGSAANRAGVPAAIGGITFTGTARSHDDVATWLDSVVGPKGSKQYLTDPFYSSSTQTFIDSTSVVGFSSTVDVTSAALAPEQKVGN